MSSASFIILPIWPKMLQGAEIEVAPWHVASSIMYTEHSTSHEVKGFMLCERENEKKDVWMWAGLPHWARTYTHLGLRVLMAEQVRRKLLELISALLPPNHCSKLQQKKQSRKQQATLAFWLSRVRCFKDAQLQFCCVLKLHLWTRCAV